MRDLSQDKIALRVTAKYNSAHRRLQEYTAFIQLLDNHHQHTAAIGQNHRGESGSEKIHQTVIGRHIVIRWLYVVMVYSDIEAERVLLSEITPDIRKINIREDKLLLYHCLLELGT
jgi:hypothetical protein